VWLVEIIFAEHRHIVHIAESFDLGSAVNRASVYASPVINPNASRTKLNVALAFAEALREPSSLYRQVSGICSHKLLILSSEYYQAVRSQCR